MDIIRVDVPRVSGECGKKATYQVGESVLFAEEVAMSHLYGAGYRSIWGENSYWWYIIALLFWDVIFAKIKEAVYIDENLNIPEDHLDSVFNLMMTTNGMPDDMFSDKFYYRRKTLFQDRFQELLNCNISYELEQSHMNHFKDNCRLIENWSLFTTKDLRVATDLLSKPKLLKIFQRFLLDVNNNRRGFPDLIVYDYERKIFFLAEVKGENDTLSPKQAEWIDFFDEIGIQTILYTVNHDYIKPKESIIVSDIQEIIDKKEATRKLGMVDGKFYCDHVEDVKELKRQNKLDEAKILLLKLVDAVEKHSVAEKSGVAPWYYEQLAIILHKQKLYDKEISILKRYMNQKHAPGLTPGKIADRLEKALNLKENSLENEERLSTTSKTVKAEKDSKKFLEVRNNSLSSLADFKKEVSWYVSISFSKSSSSNFSRALALAKNSPKYIETIDDKENIIYQAIYGSDKYLDFIALYELINTWKSSFVFINGILIDRKTIGNLNYCYGDKLRSGKTDFCFGASNFTENPFGCHRARIHRYHDPWYTFGIMGSNGIYHIDKKKIKDEIISRLQPYKMCPALNINDVMTRIDNLPNTINPETDNEWSYVNRIQGDTEIKSVIPTEYTVSLFPDKL